VYNLELLPVDRRDVRSPGIRDFALYAIPIGFYRRTQFWPGAGATLR
jgi:hypothetical protein